MIEFLSNSYWTGVSALAAVSSLILVIWMGRRRIEQNLSANVESDVVKGQASILAERFIFLFKAHGIELAQIPKFLKDIALSDLVSSEKIVSVLNSKIIADTVKYFNIEQDWLEGKDEPIYPYFYVYKDLPQYIDFLIDLKSKHPFVNGFAIKQIDDKLKKNGPHQSIVLIFQANIHDWEQSNDEPIWKYYIIRDEYSWGYWKTRFQLKAMFYIAHAFDIHVAGCQMTEQEIGNLVGGRAFPGPLLEGKSHVAWHPTEYIFTHEESAAVRDHEEVSAVRDFIGEELMAYVVEHSGPIRVFKNTNQHMMAGREKFVKDF